MKTVFGDVKTRDGHSRLSESQSVFLKDNPQLKPLFNWFKVNGITCVDNLHSSVQIEASYDIERECEVGWNVDAKFMMIVFGYTIPFQGDFDKAVPSYMELFKKIIERCYNPEYEKLIEGVRQLEVKIQRLKEQLKDDV
jgi:hypothetical protein